MAEVALDSLVVKITADTSQLDKSLNDVSSRLKGVTGNLPRNNMDVEDILADTQKAGQDLEQIAEDASGVMGRALENFATRGKLSFGSLKDSALSAFNQMAAGIVKSGLGNMFGGGGAGSFGGLITSFIGGLFGARADGGPVNAGTPYLVGERGPELFMPSTPGVIVPNHRVGESGSSSRTTNITVNLTAPRNVEGIRQSAGQVAVAVRRALAHAERNL